MPGNSFSVLLLSIQPKFISLRPCRKSIFTTLRFSTVKANNLNAAAKQEFKQAGVQLQAANVFMGAQVLLFVCFFCSSLLAILINGEFRPWSSSALLRLLSSCKQQDEIRRPKAFCKVFFSFSRLSVPLDGTTCHYFLWTFRLFTALYSDETSSFQLATIALLCEVISRADKRVARGGS